MRATTESGRGSGRWRRLGWFVLLYAAGLAATLAVAFLLRSLLPGAG